jgi:HEAT repeat protein
MSRSTIIERAKNKLEQNHAYQARRMLLEYGYLRAEDPEARAAFLELFPPGKLLREKLDGELSQLRDPDPSKRKTAATQIARAASRVISNEREQWLGDPRTTEVLIAALDREQEPKVKKELLGALSMVIMRYFPDPRALHHLAPFLADRAADVRAYAARGVAHIPRSEKWELLLPLLKDPAALVRHHAASSVGAGNPSWQVFEYPWIDPKMTAPTRKNWHQALTEAGRREKKADLKRFMDNKISRLEQ